MFFSELEYVPEAAALGTSGRQAAAEVARRFYSAPTLLGKNRLRPKGRTLVLAVLDEWGLRNRRRVSPERVGGHTTQFPHYP